MKIKTSELEGEQLDQMVAVAAKYTIVSEYLVRAFCAAKLGDEVEVPE